jgi:arsenate reductase
MAITLYHNPRCSKSRQTLALLREHNIEPEIVEYLKTPPNEATLRGLQGKLGVDVRAMMRTNEVPYKELGLGRESVTETELLAAIAAHPILLQRPIAVCGEQALIGRPPENVLELL